MPDEHPVDPDVVLSNLRNAVLLGHRAIAVTTFTILDEHLSAGGRLPAGWRDAKPPATPPYAMPQWIDDCVEHYMTKHRRPPDLGELMLWTEAESSCRMERDA